MRITIASVLAGILVAMGVYSSNRTEFFLSVIAACLVILSLGNFSLFNIEKSKHLECFTIASAYDQSWRVIGWSVMRLGCDLTLGDHIQFGNPKVYAHANKVDCKMFGKS